ncbi:MAG: CD225/dispanin family protein [Actinomycetales bacterium]|nr:CD225/dispanin family protein [Actinomycetales bacterium]
MSNDAPAPDADLPAPPAGRRERAPRDPATMLGVGVLWWSVVTMALCFLPLGVFAVVYSLRAVAAMGRGDLDRADRCWRVARRWVIWAIVVGLAVDLLIMAVLMLLGAFAGS